MSTKPTRNREFFIKHYMEKFPMSRESAIKFLTRTIRFHEPLFDGLASTNYVLEEQKAQFLLRFIDSEYNQRKGAPHVHP